MLPGWGEPRFAVSQLLLMCFEQDHEPYDTVEGAVAQWCADAPDAVLLELRQDIEEFRRDVPGFEARRAIFRFHLPFAPDGRDLDELLLKAHAIAGDLLARRGAARPEA